MKLSSLMQRSQKDNQNPNLIYQNNSFIKNSTYRSGSPLLLTPARPTEGGGTDYGEGGSGGGGAVFYGWER
jgi:hypothetical protein